MHFTILREMAQKKRREREKKKAHLHKTGIILQDPRQGQLATQTL